MKNLGATIGEQKKVDAKMHYLDSVFLDFLLPLFTWLCEHSLFLQCLPGYSQNQNESLNGTVWSKVPKHTYKGPKSMEMAGMSAVLQFDSAKVLHSVMTIAKIPPNEHAVKGMSMLITSKA